MYRNAFDTPRNQIKGTPGFTRSTQDTEPRLECLECGKRFPRSRTSVAKMQTLTTNEYLYCPECEAEVENTLDKGRKALVIVNATHSLMKEQSTILKSTFDSWARYEVPKKGWTLQEMRDVHTDLSKFRGTVVFVSPIGALIKICADLDILIFHNDQRIAKEVPDGRGGVKVVHTVAPTGWELV